MNIRWLAVVACCWYASAVEQDEFEQQPHFDLDQDAELTREKLYSSASSDLFNPCPGHSTGLAGESYSDLINVIMMSSCVLAPPCTYPRDVGGECKDKTVFDFIIVGAGTAGSVLASRLSEVPEWNVLLLEAGTDPPMTSEVPYFHLSLLKSDIDWNFLTIREKGLFNGLMGRVNRWPRGRVLGGSSTINQMLYARASRVDFDNWAAQGNVGWAFHDILPYYRKSEDLRDIYVLNNPLSSKYHARGGPLTVSRFGTSDGHIINMIREAGIELGHQQNFDLNGVTSSGFTTPNQGTIKNGERMNTAKAFLNHVKRRKNLFVIKHAQVSRVIICPETKRAYAVEYYYKTEKSPRIVRASREIILSAGVINSPKILMLSGVGPKNDLDAMNIFVMSNLRVGRNLHDHIMFPGMPVQLNGGMPEPSHLDFLDQAYEYLTRRSGVFAGIGASELVGFVSTDEDDYPDIMLHFQFGRINDSEHIHPFYKAMSIEEDLMLQIIALNQKLDLLVPIPVLLHPKSRGRVKLKSQNHWEMPHIQAGYLDEPEDFETILTGIRFIEQLIGTNAFKSMNSTLIFLNYPGCCTLTYGSDEYWACALSHIAGTYHDQGGTCKMGPPSDCEAVVDPLLRVYGVKGLRVADMSIAPDPVSAPTLATTVMIAEKAADLIKLQWIPGFTPTTRPPIFPAYNVTPTEPYVSQPVE